MKKRLRKKKQAGEFASLPVRGKCEKCGEQTLLYGRAMVWHAWGRNAFDFNWTRSEMIINLCCDECIPNNYVICNDCGDLIEIKDFGYGYENDGENICPGCVQKTEKRRLLNETRS